MPANIEVLLTDFTSPLRVVDTITDYFWATLTATMHGDAWGTVAVPSGGNSFGKTNPYSIMRFTDSNIGTWLVEYIGFSESQTYARVYELKHLLRNVLVENYNAKGVVEDVFVDVIRKSFRQYNASAFRIPESQSRYGVCDFYVRRDSLHAVLSALSLIGGFNYYLGIDNEMKIAFIAEPTIESQTVIDLGDISNKRYFPYIVPGNNIPFTTFFLDTIKEGAEAARESHDYSYSVDCDVRGDADIVIGRDVAMASKVYIGGVSHLSTLTKITRSGSIDGMGWQLGFGQAWRTT